MTYFKTNYTTPTIQSSNLNENLPNPPENLQHNEQIIENNHIEELTSNLKFEDSTTSWKVDFFFSLFFLLF